eukprot:363805-Chlamydomonas_euryale.AAC.2
MHFYLPGDAQGGELVLGRPWAGRPAAPRRRAGPWASLGWTSSCSKEEGWSLGVLWLDVQLLQGGGLVLGRTWAGRPAAPRRRAGPWAYLGWTSSCSKEEGLSLGILGLDVQLPQGGELAVGQLDVQLPQLSILSV